MLSHLYRRALTRSGCKSHFFRCHRFSTAVSPENEAKGESNDSPSTQPDLNQDSYYSTASLEPVPIKSLRIKQTVEKIDKDGLIFRNYFLGYIDKDLLSFPFLLRTRKEVHEMTQQYEMIRQTFCKIKKDEEALNYLNYNTLHELSVSEMMFVFEAIGASLPQKLIFATKEDAVNRFEKKLTKSFQVERQGGVATVDESAFTSFHNIREMIESIVPLVMHNAVVQYALHNSPNSTLQELFRGNTRVAFAYNEASNQLLPDDPAQNWQSEAFLSDKDDSWIASGLKSHIIDQDYTHYLTFMKTNTFADHQDYQFNNSNLGMVGLLLPRDKVEVESDGTDYFGIKHQKIRFDSVELDRQQYEVIASQKELCDFNNIKGCGQLAVSAVIVGLLKQLQRNIYSHLINHRIGLTKCELIQLKLYQVTCKIYSLESMLYLTAAMYDSFNRPANFELESAAVKTLAVEYAYSVIAELRSICGSRYPFASTLFDFIFYIDSLFETSLESRMTIGGAAIKHMLQHEPFSLNRIRNIFKHPIYNMKFYLQQRKFRYNDAILSKEMNKYIHPNMHGTCNWIEHCLARLNFSTYYLTNRHKEKVLEKQADLDRLATMSMELYMMIACLSRANHSLCYGIRNNHVEKEICQAICKETFLKHLDLFESVDKRVMADNDFYAHNIFQANLKHDGYFPSLFEIPTKESA